MANIWKSNSARVALRSITHCFAAAESATIVNHPSRFCSIRSICFRSHYDKNSYKYKCGPPMNLGIHFVPEQTVYIVERCSQYFKTLPTGIHFLNPFLDKIACVQFIRIETLKFHSRTATTKEKYPLSIDAWIDVKIVDPKLAFYASDRDPLNDISDLAQTTIHSELLKITLNNFEKEKEDTLPKKIMDRVKLLKKKLQEQLNALNCGGC